MVAMSKSHLHARTGHCSRAYRAWEGAKARCYNRNHPNYEQYGGRGIKVCDEWRDSFPAFLRDMGEPPSPKYTLDRFPDNNGDYRPGNCRWATKKEQGQNRRTNRLIEFNGETLCAAERARRYNMPRRTLFNRLSRGWSVEKALTTPMRDYPIGRG